MKARIGSTLAAMSLLWAAVLAPGTADAAVSSTPAPVPRLATSGTDGSVEQIRPPSAVSKSSAVASALVQ